MVQKNHQTAKKVTAQPMDSPLASEDSTHQDKSKEVEPTTEMGDPLGLDTKITWEDENSDTDRERSPLPPLPKDVDDKQPAITSFFTKSPTKQPEERDSLQSVPKEGKEKKT